MKGYLNMTVNECYDAIISLGGNCAAASQLRLRGLRRFSLPFDWLAMTDAAAISYLADELPTGLLGFFKRENIVSFNCPHQSGTAPFHYEDKKSRFCFIHHFHKSLENGGYEMVREKLHRRIDRMYRLIEKSDRILFILATSFSFDPALTDHMIASIRSRWPQKTIDFRIMQFSVPFHDSCVLADKISAAGYEIFRFHRPVGPYDLNLTGLEWSFLDDVIPGFPRKSFSFIDRRLYKAWKWISTRFLNRGYGCAGIRF